jgi:ABC-2 type transport system permease protein
MSQAMVMAGKEFKGYFNSLSAYFFIGLFVVASAGAFFWVEKFFGVGRAEVRPFFHWVPGLLAVLVPGITMRQWARENEMGSIELLMTLPVRSAELVLGKFLGCLGLLAVALFFTLGLPITAAALGDLDWGPVAGGYVAALFLGAAYIAIGMFVSSWFSDQFLAWIVSFVLCLLLAFVGHERVLDWLADMPRLTAAIRLFALWPHFTNIERGVFDFRDIVYYLSVTGFFLFLNVCMLRLRRWA